MTRNEVLYILNEIDFSDKLDNTQNEKIKHVKKTIVQEIEDTSLSRMLHTLNIFVDIELSVMTNINDVDYRLERTESLRSNIFYLVSFKQLVNSEKQDDFDKKTNSYRYWLYFS